MDVFNHLPTGCDGLSARYTRIVDKDAQLSVSNPALVRTGDKNIFWQISEIHGLSI
jgi:hypothetical protein